MDADTRFKEIWAEFIVRLKALKHAPSKKTHEDLARVCGVSKGTISRWLDGGGGEKTTFPHMLRYMQAVGMDVDGLFGPAAPCRPPDSSGPSAPGAPGAEAEAQELADLKARLREQEAALETCRRELCTYKAKWEGHLETVRARYGGDSGPDMA